MKNSINGYKKGKQFYKQKEYRKALHEFSKVDVKALGNYDESMVHHFKALCYANLMRLKKSVKEFELAAKYRPNYVRIYIDMGMTYYFFYSKSKIRQFFLEAFGKENNLQKALKWFEKGLLVEPRNAECWYYRGYMEELLDNEYKAVSSFRKCLLADESFKNREKSKLFDEVKGKKGRKQRL